MIVFYNKKNKRFVGTLDAPSNTAKIKIIPNGVKPEDIAETSINPKLLEQVIEMRKIAPSHVIVKLDKNNKVIGFSQEKDAKSYSELERAKKERESKTKENIKQLKNKNSPIKKRLDALSELIELKALIQ